MIYGQVLHGSARTTEATRRAIHQSQASLKVLAERHGINPKTVAKWKQRAFAHAAPMMGPKEVRSTGLSLEEEAAECRIPQCIPCCRWDCLDALPPMILHLSRSALHRCDTRHGISRLPGIEGDKPANTCTSTLPRGGQSKALSVIVAIDRTSTFAYAELHGKSDRTISMAFLRNLVQAVPYKLQTVVTNHGIPFCHPPRYHNAPTAQGSHIRFDLGAVLSMTSSTG